MEIKIISIVAAVVALVVFLFIARRVMRFAVRLLLVGIFVIALLALAGIGWWNGWFETSHPQKPQRPTVTRRAPSS
jgi:hypothetical protein